MGRYNFAKSINKNIWFFSSSVMELLDLKHMLLRYLVICALPVFNVTQLSVILISKNHKLKKKVYICKYL